MANEIKTRFTLVDNVSTPLDKVKAKFLNFSNNANTSMKKFLNTSNLIKTSSLFFIGEKLVNITQKIIGLGQAAFKVASDFEQLGMTLDIIVDNASQSNALFSVMREWARTSPLETRDVIQSFVKLKVIGLNPNIEKMKVLGNVALIFSRTMEDVLDGFIGLNKRTLRQLGIDIDRTGAKASIVSGNMRIETEKTDAAVREGLLKVWEERFPNAVDKAGKTSKSIFAVMRSQFTELGVIIGTKFQPAVNAVAKSLGNLARQAALALDRKASSGIVEWTDDLKTFQGQYDSILTGLKLHREKYGEENQAWIQQQLSFAFSIKASIDNLLKKLSERRAATYGGSAEQAKEEEAIFQRLAKSKKDFTSLKPEEEETDDNIEAQIKYAVEAWEKRKKIAFEGLKIINDASINSIKDSHEKELLELKNKFQKLREGKEGYSEYIKNVNDAEYLETKALKEKQIKEDDDNEIKVIDKRIKEANKLAKYRLDIQQKLNSSLAALDAINERELQKRLDRQKEMFLSLSSLASSIATDIVSASIDSTKKLRDGLKRVLITLLDYIEKKVIIAKISASLDSVISPLLLAKSIAQVGAVSALFAAAKGAVGSFANGSPILNSPTLAVVGERGRETVALPAGSQVINNHQSRNGTGASLVINVSGAIDRNQAKEAANNIYEELRNLERTGKLQKGLLS